MESTDEFKEMTLKIVRDVISIIQLKTEIFVLLMFYKTKNHGKHKKIF